MKRIFTLAVTIASMFAGAALMNAQTLSAWCETPTGHEGKMEGTDPASHIYLTVANSGENQITVTVKPYDDNTKGVNFLQVNAGGVTVTDGEAQTGDAQELLTAVVDLNAGTTTTLVEVLYGNPGWDGRWMVRIQNFDINSICGDCDLTTPPTLNPDECSLVSTTVSSATFAVSGKDAADGSISTWIVNINGNEQEVRDSENDGQITVSGLIPGTDYTAVIYAKDRCNNVSEESATIEFSTESAVSSCDGNKGYFVTPDVLKVSYSFSYANGQLTATLTPYNADETFGNVVNMAISTMTGEQPMTISSDKKSATFTTAVAEGQTCSIYFLYSLSSLAGNEMTAENMNDSEHLIYYTGGDCGQSSAINENAAASNTLWPNPASKFVNITSDEVIERVDILSENGVLVLVSSPASESAIIDIASLTVGRYIVIINTASGQDIQTMLVK